MEQHITLMSEKFLQVATLLEEIATDLRGLAETPAPLSFPPPIVADQQQPMGDHSVAIMDLMEKTGLNQQSIAVLVGVHASTISNWLKGSPVRMRNVLRLRSVCKVHGVTLDMGQHND
jgi:hypothetical protein